MTRYGFGMQFELSREPEVTPPRDYQPGTDSQCCSGAYADRHTGYHTHDADHYSDRTPGYSGRFG